MTQNGWQIEKLPVAGFFPVGPFRGIPMFIGKSANFVVSTETPVLTSGFF